ncbi:PLP-dependent cysteine synthase family protein [Bacteroidota bacterium]
MNLLDAIGNTPLIQLNNITRGLKAKVFAKLEFTNPGGSIKDRIAKYMIEKAERDGKLKPGDTIIENSSGNTAMGLAIVAKQKGYKLKIVIRDTTSKEKLEVLNCLGVDLILVDSSIPPEREDSYNNLARNIAKENVDLYYIDQHYNLDNNETYYKTFASEIWEQTESRIDYFITGVGTGGTISGSAKFLKEKNPGIKIIGIDPIGSVFYEYFKNKKLVKPGRYLIEGLGDEFLIATAQLDLLDDMIQVSDKTAFEWSKKLAYEEGIIAGGSSGANIWGAIQLAKQVNKDVNIVTVFPDSGFKYISTVYNDEWLKENNLL